MLIFLENKDNNCSYFHIIPIELILTDILYYLLLIIIILYYSFTQLKQNMLYLKYVFYSMYTVIIAFITEFDFKFNKIILFLVKVIKY